MLHSLIIRSLDLSLKPVCFSVLKVKVLIKQHSKSHLINIIIGMLFLIHYYLITQHLDVDMAELTTSVTTTFTYDKSHFRDYLNILILSVQL